MKNGGPAFPVKGGMLFYAPEELKGKVDEVVNQIEEKYEGMSLRDYFAAAALQAIKPTFSHDMSGNITASVPKDLAAYTYAIADAMLKVRATSGEAA